ncbi:dienelactone hydrolase family protein [Aliiglaciecola aliphaticivorans]
MAHQLVVCSDIFGQTESFKNWCNQVLPADWQLTIVSPYISSVNFTDEALAYSAFQQAGGIEKYAMRISTAFAASLSNKTVIGFSAGAATLYKLLSEKEYSQSIDRFYGFYPGQIRFFTKLKPSVPSQLYFPHKEPNFNIDQVIQELALHDNVQCTKTDYEHGFMNLSSRGYDKDAELTFTAEIKRRLSPQAEI